MKKEKLSKNETRSKNEIQGPDITPEMARRERDESLKRVAKEWGNNRLETLKYTLLFALICIVILLLYYVYITVIEYR